MDLKRLKPLENLGYNEVKELIKDAPFEMTNRLNLLSDSHWFHYDSDNESVRPICPAHVAAFDKEPKDILENFKKGLEEERKQVKQIRTINIDNSTMNLNPSLFGTFLDRVFNLMSF